MELKEPVGAIRESPVQRTSEQNRRLWAIVGKLARYMGGREAAEKIMREIVGETRRVALLPGRGSASPLQTTSTRDLSAEQAETIISNLSRILRNKEKACTAPQPDELPTKRQLQVIEHLRSDLGMHPPGLQTLCRRIIKKAWPQTRAEAKKLHEALAAMTLRKIPKEELAQRVGKLIFLDDGLTAWEKNFLGDINRRLANGERLYVGSLAKLREIEKKQVKG